MRLCLMNYKDALTASITDKLTKSQLIELAHALQDKCLLSELDKPQLISPKLYIKDIVSRMDIHHHEMRELNKDIRNVWFYVTQTARTLSNTLSSQSRG